jgi:hypothetical protein
LSLFLPLLPFLSFYCNCYFSHGFIIIIIIIIVVVVVVVSLFCLIDFVFVIMLCVVLLITFSHTLVKSRPTSADKGSSSQISPPSDITR